MEVKFLSPVPHGIRGQDAHGSGAFLASRVGRVHYGVDIICVPGEQVISPCNGILVRRKRPYGQDLHWSGVLIATEGGIQITLFYLEPNSTLYGHEVTKGQVIGTAQDISQKYPGIIPHIHMEVVWPRDRSLPNEWRRGHEYVVRSGANRGIYVNPLLLIGD